MEIPRRKVRLPAGVGKKCHTNDSKQMSATGDGRRTHCPFLAKPGIEWPTPVYRGQKTQNNKLRNPNAQLQSINGIMRQSRSEIQTPTPSPSPSSSRRRRRSRCVDALPYRHKFRSTSLSGADGARRVLKQACRLQVAAAGCRHATCHMPQAACPFTTPTAGAANEGITSPWQCQRH